MGQFLTAEEVGEIMGYSASHSYSIIRELNSELKAKGYIIRNGRIPRKYFFERVGLDPEGAATDITKQITDYTRLCKELSELPDNAESSEAYEPTRRRRQELRDQIAASKRELDEVLKNDRQQRARL